MIVLTLCKCKCCNFFYISLNAPHRMMHVGGPEEKSLIVIITLRHRFFFFFFVVMIALSDIATIHLAIWIPWDAVRMRPVSIDPQLCDQHLLTGNIAMRFNRE